MKHTTVKIGRYYQTNETAVLGTTDFYYGSVLKTLKQKKGSLVEVEFIKGNFKSMLGSTWKIHTSHFKNYKLVPQLRAHLLYTKEN